MLGLELICFGPPTARVGGERAAAEVLWRKHLALLIYLALSPTHTRSRPHLLGLLWPETSEPAARHSLNEAVRRLRGCLGTERILSQGELLALSPAGLRVDALEFEALAAVDPARAARLLRGDFLEGFVIDDGPQFEEWATRERERYRAAGGALLVAEGERCLLESDTSAAQDWARRGLSLAPCSETAVRLLMHAAALDGDRSGALAAYQLFVQRIGADLGETPSRALSALADRIRQDRWRGVAVRPAPAVPLVGRPDAHRSARSIITMALGSRPQVLVIAGDPGSGRTRLLADCVDRLALDGTVVAVARPLESDHDAPWSTLRVLMRAGLSRAPGIAATDPDALRVLSAISEELAERAAPREPRDRAEVAAALAATIRAIADEIPVALAVDDAHLADGATLGALHGAVSALQSGRVILIVTTPQAARTGAPELLALRAAVGGALAGATVRLDPLSLEEVRELVRLTASWCPDDGAFDRLSRRIAFESAGNPLLAVTLLRALQDSVALRRDVLEWPAAGVTLDSPLPVSVPALARLAVTARVAALTEESRRVLAVASILGPALDLEIIGRLTGIEPAVIEDLLPPMEHQGLLAFDGQRYAFAAPLIAEVVRGEFVTGGQRATIRHRAAALLAGRPDLESRVLRVELLARARSGLPALADAVAVARDALANGAPRSASRAVAAAQRLLASGDIQAAEQVEHLRVELSTLTADHRAPGH